MSLKKKVSNIPETLDPNVFLKNLDARYFDNPEIISILKERVSILTRNAFLQNAEKMLRSSFDKQTADNYLNDVARAYNDGSIPTLKNQITKITGKEFVESARATIGSKSVYGGAYDMGNFVIKTMHACVDGTQNELLAAMCKEANKGDKIVHIPNSITGKTVLFTPAYITEGAVSILLSKLLYYTPCFVDTLGLFYDRTSPKKTMYFAMEKLDMILPYIRLETDLIYTLFQLTYALYLAQKVGRYCHFDLHIGNVMARKSDGNVNIFKIDNDFVYTRFNFVPVIIDYGRNRFETDKYELVSSTIESDADNLLNYYYFNPYFDLYCLLNVFSKTFPDRQTSAGRICAELFAVYLKVPIDELYNAIEFYKRWEWMPEPNKLLERPPLKPQLFLKAIIFAIKSQQTPISSRDDLADTLNKYGIVVTPSRYSFPNEKVYHHPSSVMSTSVLPIKTYSNITDEYKFGPVTIKSNILAGIKSPYNRDTKPYSKLIQYAHIARIDHNLEGYKFRFDCCRVDLNTMLQSGIDSGISINASFFNNIYQPTGIYKSPGISSDKPIPKKYEKYYGYICIDSMGKINILDKPPVKGRYPNIISTGPLLVWNGIAFKEKYFNAKDENGKLLFQCSNRKGARVPTCNGEPGSLSGIAKLRPRSALAIDRDGNVFFIYAEGYGERGDGLDVLELANLCVDIGAVKAINLSDGYSSQMMWKSPGIDSIHQLNPEHNYKYPVGTSISLVKE